MSANNPDSLRLNVFKSHLPVNVFSCDPQKNGGAKIMIFSVPLQYPMKKSYFEGGYRRVMRYLEEQKFDGEVFLAQEHSRVIRRASNIDKPVGQDSVSLRISGDAALEFFGKEQIDGLFSAFYGRPLKVILTSRGC